MENYCGLMSGSSGEEEKGLDLRLVQSELWWVGWNRRKRSKKVHKFRFRKLVIGGDFTWDGASDGGA